MKTKSIILTLGIVFAMSGCSSSQSAPTVPTLESISLSGNYKTQYFVGDKLDTTGLVVTANYDDKSSKAVLDYVTSGFDSSTIGDKEVVVTYQEKTASFTIHVLAVELEKISLSGNYKTQYYVGDSFDKTNLIVNAIYNDGSSEKVSNYQISGFDSSSAGDKVLTVSYNGKSATFTVHVSSVEISSISVGGTYKTKYFLGQELDLTGLVVTATYNNGKTESVTGYTTSGFNSSSIGEKTVNVSYEGKSTSFKVNVYSDKYNLNLTINVDGTFTNFGNIQIAYNYDNSSEYTWGHQISKVAQSQYTYELEDLDASKTLYFKIYIWDTIIGNCYIGGEGDSNFAREPVLGIEKQQINVNFIYPTSENTVGVVTEASSSTSMTFANQTVNIYKNSVTITPTFDKNPESFVATYEGENIRIDDNKTIVGLKAGTNTEVTLTSVNGLTCKFTVSVSASNYKATSERDTKWASGEKWFTSTSVSEISNMSSDFMNGIDISSCKALYDNGTKFFNADGVEQSLFYILKDAGVNWVRFKLWVDPYTNKGTSYGGGNSDLENTIWMAKEATFAGLKILLDFHYSDYWTHPGQQVVPKAWASVSSANELATLIKNYTKDTLNRFKEEKCLPEMVQLGNEISSGSFSQKPGTDSETFTNYLPNYINGKSNFAYKATAGSDNMNKYLSAGVEGAKEVDENIKTVVHWAKGSSISANVINNFFNDITANYDYAALSFYPYYCFDNMNDARTILNGLNISKPWFIAETSYPFSSETWVYENNQNVAEHAVNGWTTGITNIKSSYPFSPVGQANIIHDLTKEVVDAGGKGIFYWEGAWVPNIKVGWAGANSPVSWANQGFFSFDGKAIANLNIFNQISPHII